MVEHSFEVSTLPEWRYSAGYRDRMTGRVPHDRKDIS